MVNHHTYLEIHLPLLTVLHSTVDGVASTANDITLSTTRQQSFNRLDAAQAAGHVQRRLAIVVQLVHPRAHTRAHDLNMDGKEGW